MSSVRVTITDHRGALQAGAQPATRTVRLEGLAPDVAADLAAVVLDRPPTWPAPGLGTHRTPKAGGRVVVTLEVEDQTS